MESQQLPTDPAVHPRPQRERRLPSHLDDFAVGYHPTVTDPSTQPAPVPTAEDGAAAPELTVLRSPSPQLPVRIQSRRGSVASHHSTARSQASARSLSQRSLTKTLSELQNAMLEERMKRMELAEAQRQQAREALHEKEELLREQEQQRRRLEEKAEIAYKTKEAITRQQILQRRLKEKEMEVEKAALITSFLKEEETKSPPHSRPLSVSEYNLRLPSTAQPLPPRSQGPPDMLHSTPVTQAPPPVNIYTVKPPVSTSPSPILAAAIQDRVSAITIPPVVPVANPSPLPRHSHTVGALIQHAASPS
ncbi:serine/arginine repetitive matrix protein 1 [Boleophthalmus pectinirostris]|uniref:serine/arginine repetitive matrix protein 1 n=1 Tax=Boleophthalmus pectinirostris TaxID=150288 RepID=UPI0024315EB3|nr:serine/arginine repetitive matrix protein 1 [Boleophthalmus pectinirostris]